MGASPGRAELTTQSGCPRLPQTPSAGQHSPRIRRAVRTCTWQDEVNEGRGSNQTLGQRTPIGLGIRMQNHTPPCGRSLISQRGMSDGHTLPQGRNGSANQRPMRRNGWGQLVGMASGPRQLRKQPSRAAPSSPPYSCALRRTSIMADLLVDSRAPRSMCVRWRERATSRLHHPPTPGDAAALRCCP